MLCLGNSRGGGEGGGEAHVISIGSHLFQSPHDYVSQYSDISSSGDGAGSSHKN